MKVQELETVLRQRDRNERVLVSFGPMPDPQNQHWVVDPTNLPHVVSPASVMTCADGICANAIVIVVDPPGQPDPTPNDHPAVWDLVMEDMRARDELGRQRYGTRLQPHNGRKTLRDAYEEALDLAVYLRQELFEREGK